MKTFRRKLVVLVAAAAVSLTVAACGSDEGGEAASGGGKRETLKMSVPSAIATWGAVYVAQSEGIFDKHDLDVEMSVGGSLVNTRLLSGQIDLAGFNPPFDLINKGADVRVIWGAIKDTGVSLITGEKVTTIDELRAQDRCRLASFPPGSSNYAYAQKMTKQLDLDCEIVVAADNPAILAGVQAGSYTAGLVNQAAIAQGPPGINVLIEADGGEKFAPYALPPHLLGVIYGDRANLEKKKDAVGRFVTALSEAQQLMLDEAKTEQTAAQIRESADWAQAQSPEWMVEQLEFWRPFLWTSENGNVGDISEQDWASTLDAFELYGLEGYDAANPKFAYDQLVDRSYYEQAVGATR